MRVFIIAEFREQAENFIQRNELSREVFKYLSGPSLCRGLRDPFFFVLTVPLGWAEIFHNFLLPSGAKEISFQEVREIQERLEIHSPLKTDSPMPEGTEEPATEGGQSKVVRE